MAKDPEKPILVELPPGVYPPNNGDIPLSSLPISQNPNHPVEDPVSFSASDAMAKLAASAAAGMAALQAQTRPHSRGISRAPPPPPSLPNAYYRPEPPSAPTPSIAELVGDGKRTVRESLREAKHISDERDSVRDGAQQGPSSPNNDHSVSDHAVLGFCEILALMFGLPPGEALFRGEPLSLRLFGFIAVGALFAALGPGWPAVRRNFPQQALVLSIGRMASDARYWLAIILVGFLYSASPEIYRRATAPAVPPTVTESTPIRIAKPLDGQKIITGAQLVEKVDALQSQLDTTKKDLENTNTELKVAQQAPGSLSSLGKALLAPPPTPELTNPLCLNGKCPPPSSPGNIFAIPSPDKIAELEAAVRKLEEENRRLEMPRQASAVPQPLPPSPAPKGPIIWNLDSQFLIVSYDTAGEVVNGIILQGTSTSAVGIKEAYAVSGMTGHRQELMAAVPNKGPYPANKVDIPPQAPVQLDIDWKPPLLIRDFIDQWSKLKIVIIYSDGTTYEHDFDENYVLEKLKRMAPTAFGPRITPKDDK
jgi:hypothetical protein